MANKPFQGVIPPEEFIDNAQLSAMVGMEKGESMGNDIPWLHFNLDGKTLMVPMVCLRHSLSWDDINEIGCVDGTKQVTIADKVYKVRLLKGINGTPNDMGGKYDPPFARHSEWNRLMYPIHGGLHIDDRNERAKEIASDPDGGFTDSDLGIHHQVSLGNRSWCQETIGIDAVQRGMMGVTYYNRYRRSSTYPSFGWRPVLELI